MSIGSLLSMRPTWLLTQTVSLGDGGRFRPLLTAAPGLANTEVISWANAQCAVDQAPGMVAVKPNAQKAYGFLPWQPGGVTYLEIPGNVGAQLVLTGPLSACTVWAFQAGGSTVLVHANANAVDPATNNPVPWAGMSRAGKAANMQTKLNLVNAIKALYPGAADVARLVYARTPGVNGARRYEGYAGFVIGCKPRSGFSLNSVSWTGRATAAADWTFYFYGYNGPAATDRVLWVLN